MTIANDTSGVSVAGPVVGDVGLGDSLAFTGAGPFPVLLAVLGLLSAAGGSILRFFSGRIGRRAG